MTPALPVPLPGAHRPPVGQAAPGEWFAIDASTAFDCTVSPCAHLLDVPHELRVDWARARTEVFDQIAAARIAGDAVWHLSKRSSGTSACTTSCFGAHDAARAAPPG